MINLDTVGDLGTISSYYSLSFYRILAYITNFTFFYRKGTRFHESRGKHYSPGYGEGDTLGFLIILPDAHDKSHIPNTYKDRVNKSLNGLFLRKKRKSLRLLINEFLFFQPLVKFKSHLYYEEKDQVPEALKALKPLSGSKIIFYKNGISQGEAFLDIYKGAYYPTISIHKSATVSVNFGPNFKTPPTDESFKGVRIMIFRDLCKQCFSTFN